MGKLDAFQDVIQTGVEAKQLTWLRLGGSLEFLAQPRNERELLDILQACASEKLEARMLGDGSNILVSDLGAPGVAIRLSNPAFSKITLEGDRICVGAGAKLGRVATTAAGAGLAGLEGLVGIPGTVGAAMVTNVSTSSSSLGQYVESARVASYQGEIFELTRDDFVFGYRSSNLENAVILEARFKLEQDDPEELLKRLQQLWIVRKKKLSDLENVGYARMFKNPRGQSAAELVREAGFSGAGVGGARVSQTDPNLVYVSEPCSSDDVKRLISLIQKQASERVGVDLEWELEIW